MSWWRFQPRVTAHQKRRNTVRERQRLEKQGEKLAPVVIEGRTIATSFWGKAWCENLEAYRDFEYRLPRGRTYVRSGSVIDLKIEQGKVTALVCGSELYRVQVTIKPVTPALWTRICAECSGEVGSLIELLQGRLSERVMRIITDRDKGLFPKPGEIAMTCSCPDMAVMCKHVAAALYGVGARLDTGPELLFRLRNADHGELIAKAATVDVGRKSSKRKTIADDALGDVFGIDLGGGDSGQSSVPVAKKQVKKAGKAKVVLAQRRLARAPGVKR